MLRIKIAGCMLVALAGAVAIVVDRDKRDAAAAPRDGRLLMAGFAEPEPIAESPPSRAAARWAGSPGPRAAGGGLGLAAGDRRKPAFPGCASRLRIADQRGRETPGRRHDHRSAPVQHGDLRPPP